MAFARDVYTAGAAATDFTVTYPYEQEADVLVTVDGTLKTTVTDYSFSDPTTVQFVVAMTGGETVVLERSTSQDTRTVNFVAGVFTSEDLNDSARQMFYMAQESIDQVATALKKDSSEIWDATTILIQNVVDPVSSQDAATKNYVDSVALGTFPSPLGVGSGGTGSATAATARIALGLSTVSQVEAEAGTGTTERSWTAQRVSQAIAALAVEPVGTVKQTIVAVAPTGWVLLNGDTLGSAASGATLANASYEALYTAFWDGMADAQAAVSTGRGASAAADFAADKTLTMPDGRGRALIMTGSGAGLTARTHGDGSLGAEDTIVVTHLHAVGTLAADSAGAHTHNVKGDIGGGGGTTEPTMTTTGQSTNTGSGNALSSGAHGHAISGSSANTGTSGTDANMPPFLALNFIVKT